MSVGVDQDRLAPQVRLIGGIADEVEPGFIELLDGLVESSTSKWMLAPLWIASSVWCNERVVSPSGASSRA